VSDSAQKPVREAPSGDAPDVALSTAAASAKPRRWRLPPHEDPRDESTIRAFAGGSGLETDDGDDEETLVVPTTGVASRRAWKEAFRHEEQRLARYGSRVTLVVTEIDGLDLLAMTPGQRAAERLIQSVGEMLRLNARSADVTARFGRGRFVALLPETDEVAAINYVERVRSECDAWFEAQGLALRLAIGWAQPVGASLADALRLADDRMNSDRRRLGLRTPEG
jgi:diguanylate cyclase (GGDEF)-like protein